MNLSGYDAWKTTDPSENRCQHCGIDLYAHKGWAPDECDGSCGIEWRDPDRERDERMER